MIEIIPGQRVAATVRHLVEEVNRLTVLVDRLEKERSEEERLEWGRRNPPIDAR